MHKSSTRQSSFWKCCEGEKSPRTPCALLTREAIYRLGPAGDQPGWATGAALDLCGTNEDRGPRRRNPAEIRHAFETPFVAAEQRLVGLELLGRPDVQRDGIDADAGNIALCDQE